MNTQDLIAENRKLKEAVRILGGLSESGEDEVTHKSAHQKETDLIKDLESKRFHPDSKEYHQNLTAIRDAYWRRRMLSAKKGEVSP